MTKIRLQKYLSDLGISSRKQTEDWITKGLVTVNGKVIAELGFKFDPKQDVLKLDKSLRKSNKYYYYFFNKPKSVVTVNPQKNELEVLDLVNVPEGVVTVGRLDKDSQGLLLLTNDGVVARRIMDPNFNHEKEYLVVVNKTVKFNELKMLSSSIYINGQKTRPAKVKLLGNKQISITLTEGKNRQVRRLCQKAGLKVLVLVRIRLLNFSLGSLKIGKMRKLSDVEVSELYRQLDLLQRQEIINNLF